MHGNIHNSEILHRYALNTSHKNLELNNKTSIIKYKLTNYNIILYSANNLSIPI